MNCANCGGKLEGSMRFCAYCGVRQDVDFRRVAFRDLGAKLSMPCPACRCVLGTIELPTDPPLRIERCPECYGLFFNPGEVEAYLEAHTGALVWVDQARLDEIASDYGPGETALLYRKCPVCAERMSPHHIGGSSGVIVQRCGTHGMWLEHGSLRRLAEWWHAGGKHLHQQDQAGMPGGREQDIPGTFPYARHGAKGATPTTGIWVPSSLLEVFRQHDD